MKKVVLTPNPYRDRNFQTVREAVRVLSGAGIETKVCLPFEIDKTCELPRDLRLCRLDRELPTADAVICFGGDGTILHMAKAATRQGVPILGVNIGTMGFMAELESGELSALSRLADDAYTLDSRMMLDVTVQRDRNILFHDICLNDAAITKGAVARIVPLTVCCDGVPAMQCSGDGVIVATPTGSTAYSLSAGGPIVEPEAHGILITPICAHDMTSRCIVASENRVITVGLAKSARRNAYLSVDGGKAFRLTLQDRATIRRSTLQCKLIRLRERSFYEVVSTKFRSH